MKRNLAPAIATLAAALALGLSLASSARAAGFYIQEQSVKALGRANSGEAADVGPESLWWNSASIAQVEGIQVSTGTHFVFSKSDVVDRGSTILRPGQLTAPVGGDPRAHDPLRFGAVPNLDAAWRVNEHLAVGLAVSAPFDFTTRYRVDSFARYQALTSKLLDFDVQPTIAIHVNRYLDLGAGVDAQYAKATLSSALPNLSPLLPDGGNQLHGSGWNYGWTVGAQVHPAERLTIGASYRSKIDHKLDGTLAITGLLGPLAGQNATAAGNARFTTPWIVVVAARFVVDTHWALNAQLQRVGWSEFDAIRVTTPGGVTAIPQGYHDTTTAAVGVDYTVNPTWTLRTGVTYDPTPTPDIGRTARVPDGDRVIVAMGTTVRRGPRLQWDAALAFVHLRNSQINSDATAYAGTPAVTPIAYRAEVKGHSLILSFGARYHF